MDIQTDPRITHSSNLTPRVPDPGSSRSHKQLRESAREMESIYIYQMYKSMRKTLPEDGLFPQSSTSKTFQEMLDLELARKAASGNGTGLGEGIYQQLKDQIK